MSYNNQNNNNNQYRPVTVWDLFSRPLSSFEDEDNGFFPAMTQADSFKVDVKDEGQAYVVTADLPGVKKEDVNVRFEDGVLTISAAHHTSKEENTEGYLMKERVSGTYSRQFGFDNADQNGIEAAFDNGVLKVTLQKKQPRQNQGVKVTVR